MTVIDTHYHWYPTFLVDYLRRRRDYPSVEPGPAGEFTLRFNGGANFMNLDDEWLDLDAGLAKLARSFAEPTIAIGTAGVLSGLLDQLPAGEAAAVARDYNQALADAQRSHPGRFYGTAMVPFHDERTAIELLQSAVADLDLHGLNLAPAAADGPIDQQRLHGLYEAAAELSCPVLIHPTDFVYPSILGGYDRALHLTLGRLLDSSVTVLRLIFSGILERNPALKVVHTHSGGVLPYQAGRIDKNGPRDLGALPSAYLARTYVDTVSPQALTIRTALEFYGADHVLYGTDHPCWSVAVAARNVDDDVVPAADQERVKHLNAERVFNLPASV